MPPPVPTVHVACVTRSGEVIQGGRYCSGRRGVSVASVILGEELLDRWVTRGREGHAGFLSGRGSVCGGSGRGKIVRATEGRSYLNRQGGL